VSTAQVIKPELRCCPHEGHPAATNGYMQLRAVRALSPPRSRTASCESTKRPTIVGQLGRETPQHAHVNSVRNWLEGIKPVIPEESAYLNHSEDPVGPI